MSRASIQEQKPPEGLPASAMDCVAHIPLISAAVCAEPLCESVFDSDVAQACPACGSSSYALLTRWIPSSWSRPYYDRVRMGEPE